MDHLDANRGIPVFPARTLSHRGGVVWEERPRLILARQHTLPFSKGRLLLLDCTGPQVQVDDSEADERLRRKVLGLEDKSKHAVPEQVRMIRTVPDQRIDALGGLLETMPGQLFLALSL